MLNSQRRLYVKRLPREATAIIMLRRNWGHRINHLAKALGRSTSFVYRILKQTRKNDKTYVQFDKRKIHRNAKMWNSHRMLKTLYYYIEKWQDFILGLDDEPP